jgi:hypothetical protein
MALKIKTVATNLEIGTIYGDKRGIFSYEDNKEVFSNLIKGQFYKV